MNNLKNKVSLIGRLGNKPEVINLQNGNMLTRFRLAANESYKDKQGEWKQQTQWITINTWGKLAIQAEKVLEKGQEIFLEGKLVSNSYESNQGEKRYSTHVEASEFMIIQPSTKE
jgi:single-strand DNA-binding protein